MATIPLYQVQAAVAYAAASAARSKVIKQSHDIDFGRTPPEKITELVDAALTAGTKCGIYSSSRIVLAK